MAEVGSGSEHARLLAVFNHLVLPLKLPGRGDRDSQGIATTLIQQIINSVKNINELSPAPHWELIRRSVLKSSRILGVNDLNEAILLGELRELLPGEFILVHVNEQNASVLIFTDAKHGRIVFEIWEASATGQSVLESEDYLTWSFPGTSVSLPITDFQEEEFVKELAKFLDQAHHENVKLYGAVAFKAQTTIAESRDTAQPHLVSRLLATIIGSLGTHVDPVLLTKHVRDDACWTDGTHFPWRRSPVWLSLRVAIQRRLYAVLGDQIGRAHYKFFMALLLTRFLDQISGHLTLELAHGLKAKICSRMAKLEQDRKSAAPDIKAEYDRLFKAVGPTISSILQKVDSSITNATNTWRRQQSRSLTLPKFPPKNALSLQLQNSGIYLRSIVETPHMVHAAQSSTASEVSRKSASDGVSRNFELFASQCYYSADAQLQLTHDLTTQSDKPVEEQCIFYARNLIKYLKESRDAFDYGSSETSLFVLAIMEAWIRLDQAATEWYPLLKEYHTGFDLGMFEDLQLLFKGDMERLHSIEQYLELRNNVSIPKPGLFDRISEDCFAYRYATDPKAQDILKCRQDIDARTKKKIEAKTEELERAMEKYRKLFQEQIVATCIYETVDGQRVHSRGCPKCKIAKDLSRQRIALFEKTLPEDDIQALSICFELLCPLAFACYRDATWMILQLFGFQETHLDIKAQMLLDRHPSLENTFPNRRRITLASAKKSFMQTHYAPVKLPATIDDVIVPTGLRYEYYDTEARTWPARGFHAKSLAALAKPDITDTGSLAASILQAHSDARSSKLSSNHILSTQVRCPRDVPLSEFLAAQSLISRNYPRCLWTQILVELGQMAINFSSQPASVTISTIVSRVGPPSSDIHRISHAILASPDFGARLHSKLRERLDSISHSTSEVNILEMLIDIATRLWSLTSSEHVKEDVSNLMGQIRATCYDWIQINSEQLQGCHELAVIQRISRQTLRTALLSRKTFMIHDQFGDLGPHAAGQLAQAAIAMHRNIDREVEKLPAYYKHAFRRDLKWIRGIRKEVVALVSAHPEALLAAMRSVYHGFFSSCSLGPISIEGETRISCLLDGAPGSMHLLFNPIEGQLLVNGHPEGNLPREYQNHPALVELFGNQPLTAWRTQNYGMEWMLTFHPLGQDVLLGSRPGIGLVIRTVGPAGVFELIPRTKFVGGVCSDLPGYLLAEHFHWLELGSRLLHIRKAKFKWETKPSSWILNLYTGQVLRRDAVLVDPTSRSAQQVHNILSRLESNDFIIVFCGKDGKTCVELPRMELRFKVNRYNRLQSYQLLAEIDDDQDAGTLYGLVSKLVLRNVQNPNQRSIIVPFGMPRYRLSGEWPEILITSDRTGFARFEIDPILGRLTCASEPRLLYFKAYLNALTTSVVPDPLTGRTGAEEAIYWLSSGCAVPWQPLAQTSINFLKGIRNLSPRSEYYPVNLKRLRKAHWFSTLSVCAQDPRYRLLVDKLVERSDSLASFRTNVEPTQDEEEPLIHQEDPHLHKRILIRHELYRRSLFDEQQLRSTAVNLRYHSRDTPASNNILCRKVAKIVAAICTWPSSMRTTTNLVGLVEMVARQVDTIAGYNKEFDLALLSDRIDGYALARDFGPLLYTCRGLGRNNKARLAFLLGPLAFNGKADIEILLTALAFAMWPELHEITIPTWEFYSAFVPTQMPPTKDLIDLVRPHCTAYKEDEELQTDYLHAKQKRANEKARRQHEQDIEKQCAGFVKILLKQWPALELDASSFPATDFPLLDSEAAILSVKPAWERYISTMNLTQYLEAVRLVLDSRALGAVEIVSSTKVLPNASRMYHTERKRVPLPTIRDLMRLPCTVSWSDIVPTPCRRVKIMNPEATQKVEKLHELRAILRDLATTLSKTQIDFAKKMQTSLHSLKVKLSRHSAPDIPIIPDNLDREIQFGTMNVFAHTELIKSSLQAQEVSWTWLHLGGLLPMLTKVDILQTLRLLGSTGLDFGVNSRESVIHLGALLAQLQRLCRVQDAHLKDNKTRLQDELEQLQSRNFDPEKNPNWLLFELDSNVTLRRAQIDVANATVSPSSGENSLHQLMMGQGKTSCILPISALSLANGHSLLRVVVPRALVLQTAQLLQHRLGALNGRPIMHIPFSRKSSTTTDQIRLLRMLHEEVLWGGGVIVTTPEHSLSLMLSGIQRTIDQRTEEARELVSLQRWLQSVSRNILDESDLILDCKTQLIYPSGTLAPVDGHPYRWQAAQKLFQLVKAQLWSLQQKYPMGIQVFESARGFPFVYFLRKEAEDELIRGLVEDLTAETSTILPMKGYTEEQRAMVRDFIALPVINSEVKKHLDNWNPELRKTIYLLRGLLVHRILLHVLKKRWNVQYGIPKDRAPIAVPFVAKGTPSENAEYGHCDVSILLTILAFYYGGVSKQQLQQVLEFILRSDNAGSEYERITDTVALPERWRSLQAINIKDDSHMEELHLHLRYSIVVCDLFLNHLVFPQHARQFDVKIAASGWDITGAQLSKESTALTTTGFSGTIDNAGLLPLTIAQQELEEFKHTNAEALVYLLEDRNSHYQVLRQDGQRLSEELLLKRLYKMGIRCLIDSGSFILELSNEEVAKLWLDIDTSAPAAIYFGSDNRAWIQYRAGLRIPLIASPFADNTGDALVYFSNAHCRGSDLKLPPSTRGALTLGMYHTKDALVQSAMRLRLLPLTQSVTFFAPPEVHQAILDCIGKTDGDRLGSRDVVSWILRETCRSIEELQPLWHSQGLEYLHRTQALLEYPDFVTNTRHRQSALKILCQREKLQLEDLYGTRARPGKLALSAELTSVLDELRNTASQFHDAGHAVHASALQEVEQEREVEQEVAHEQQVQRPRYHNPHQFHGLHPDLQRFVETARISERSGAIEHYGSFLARTLIGRRYGVSRTMSKLYITTDFGTTVNAIPPSDNFMRPVNWVLWSDVQKLAILICPEEAHLLFPMPRSVALLAYSAPTTRSTMHFNDLTYCSIPPLPSDFEFPLWLRVELGIFAGKLFFKFEEYDMIKELLGVKGAFGHKPLAFLQDWLTLRRIDQDILDTPMGYVIQGRDLTENHHFFRKDATSATPHHLIQIHEGKEQVNDDMDDDFFDEQFENDPNEASDDDEEDEKEEKHLTTTTSLTQASMAHTIQNHAPEEQELGK